MRRAIVVAVVAVFAFAVACLRTVSYECNNDTFCQHAGMQGTCEADKFCSYSDPACASGKPKFFIQGERDELCPLKNMQEFYGRAHDPKELVVIDGADHLFDGKVLEVGDAIEDLFGDWEG